MQALFDAALENFERGVGIPVERIEVGDIFRAGNPSMDWFVLCVLEQVHHLGWEFCDANYERFSPLIQGSSTMRGRRRSTSTWWSDAGASNTCESSTPARGRRRPAHADELPLVDPNQRRRSETGEPGDEADAFNTDPQNMTGHPATSVPAGVSPDGVRSASRSPRRGSATTSR